MNRQPRDRRPARRRAVMIAVAAVALAVPAAAMELPDDSSPTQPEGVFKWNPDGPTYLLIPESPAYDSGASIVLDHFVAEGRPIAPVRPEEPIPIGLSESEGSRAGAPIGLSGGSVGDLSAGLGGLIATGSTPAVATPAGAARGALAELRRDLGL